MWQSYNKNMQGSLTIWYGKSYYRNKRGTLTILYGQSYYKNMQCSLTILWQSYYKNMQKSLVILYGKSYYRIIQGRLTLRFERITRCKLILYLNQPFVRNSLDTFGLMRPVYRFLIAIHYNVMLLFFVYIIDL